MKKLKRAERSYLTYYLDVIDLNSGESIGRVADMTIDGLMILSKETLPVGTKFDIKVVSADDHFVPIEFSGDCRWCKIDVNPKYYDIGFHIDTISDNNKQKIDDLITSSLFN